MKRKKAMGGTSSSSSRTAASETETAASETETAASRLFSVPMEILEKLFLNLPPEEVVCTCRLVCRQWKEMADSEYLWTERCRRESYHLRDVSRTPKDWRLFYFLCKKRRNLLKNPREEDQLLGWKILEKVYDKSSNSYYFCKKSQLIDLEREGYNPEFMDHFQPDIKISDWYAPRWDCPSQYEICVELLNQKKKPIHTFAPETIVFGPWNIGIWHQMTHVFQNYGPGVRYIRFTHGRDKSKYWGGWYGLRITDSCVEICPSVETQ
ncbi:F-box only protein 44-like isoform X4 [Anabas testudineus]|uniref:F-box only protein 44-like isoform X4 n=1 Tax=Anabas testudineus TaxID=64144 RepID=UPI000E463BB3|nr:F-box only protein 44-like isoform X4 [Anabas testudineus]